MAFVFYVLLSVTKYSKPEYSSSMPLPFIADQTFNNQDFTNHNLSKAQYDNCQFIHCNFEESFLATIEFYDCTFTECNFSNAKLKEAVFKDVIFERCKMVGLPFSTLNNFFSNFTFRECKLDYSDFSGLNMSHSTLDNCSLIQADFTETNLSNAIVSGSDLEHVIFDRSKLKATNFRTSINYQIQPERNQMKGAQFSRTHIDGLLGHHQIKIE